MCTANNAPAQTEVVAGSDIDERVAVAVVAGKMKGGRGVEGVEMEGPRAAEPDDVTITGTEETAVSSGWQTTVGETADGDGAVCPATLDGGVPVASAAAARFRRRCSARQRGPSIRRFRLHQASRRSRVAGSGW